MIDRYEILRKLATGGMAELFLAKQSGLEGFEKVVVIKRILSHLAQDEEFVTMFLDEARIAAKLSHPNIVQIYDLGKADDSYYIAMEYVSGRNVQHILTKQEEKSSLMPIEHACRIVAGVCDGLHYAHSRKDYDGQPLDIVHRDVSPQNVLVSFAGGVKVVDFGIAKASTQLAQTRAGVLKGKYAYMSPEQVRGQSVDHRSDIFAVGLVMYEMLTGRRAFERDSSLKTLKAIVQEKPLNPRELNPEIPSEVVKLLSRGLEKNPDRRYKNAQEMQLAIEDYLESSPRKSNNVRLSRYLYELFDDELNSESGTMVVQGIGEVIIPTGASPGDKRKVSVEEDVDSKTLSAALAPARPEEDSEQEASVGGRRPSEPGVRVVRDDQNSGGEHSAPGGEPIDDDEPFESTNVNAEPPRPPVGGEDFEESEEEEEPEDKTIPVYDLDDYERQRKSQFSQEEATAGDAPPIGMPPGLEADPSDATAAALDVAAISGGGRAKQSADKRAAELLAKVEAMAEGVDDSNEPGETIPPPSMGTEPEDDTDWEDPTQQAPPTSPLMPEGLHSTEAVVGPDGPVPLGGDASSIRPAAAAGAEVRPAAMGARGHANPNLKEVSRPGAHESTPSPASPPNPPSAPVPALSESGGGALQQPTPATGRSIPAQAQAQSQARRPAQGGGSGGLPTAAIVGIGAIGLFLLVSVGALVALFVMKGGDEGQAGAPRLMQLDTIPSGLTFKYNGAEQQTPAKLIVTQGAPFNTEISYDGTPYSVEFPVPLGNEPYELTLRMSDYAKAKSPQGP